MEKSLAISLVKSGNLSKEQVKAIVNAVDEEDRADVLACVKGNDPEGATMNTFLKEFLPAIVKASVKEALATAGQSGAAGASGASGDSGTSGASGDGDETCMKEILSKLDDILDNEESKDENLQKLVKEEEGKLPEVPDYAGLKKKWEDGTLDDAEAKEYMKIKTGVRKRARAALKAGKLKAEKEAINELTDPESKANQNGNMGSSGFDKNVKKIFEDDREIEDPEEISKLMAIATEAVENGTL